MSDDSNISPQEQRDLHNPGIGSGTPETAPWQNPPVGEPSWRPTRKLVRAAATGLASIVGSWIVTGAFDDVERGMTATLLTALATAYFSENDPTPGGIPEA